MSTPTGKDGGLQAAISRKFALSVVAFLGVLFAIGILWILIVGAPDPAAEAARRAEAARLEQIALQITVPEGEAARMLEQSERDARMRAEARQRELDAIAKSNDIKTAAPAGPPSANVIDNELLRELDAMQRELGSPPGFNTPAAVPMPGDTSASGGKGGGMGVYEDTDVVGAALGVRQESPVETVLPRVIPERTVHRGVMLRAVLNSMIDTRNDGPITATITRDVYDSRSVSRVLIPRGSRLMGAYTTSVAPGVDRIAVSFDYLILPDGRAVELPSMPSAATDGTIGVEGRYRSNLLRAIGPAFLVAAVGQWVDRTQQPDGLRIDPTQPLSQAPSIMQQVVPQISEAIQERYSAAKPYFLASPGQEIRIVVTQEIEIPK